MLRLIKKYEQWIRYLVVGGLTTGVNILAFYLLVQVVGWNYLIGNAAAWLLSVLFAFYTNKHYVFGSGQSGRVLEEMVSFFSCRIFSGLLDMAIMYLFIDLCGLHEMAVKLFANVVVILLNYFLSKFVVFKRAGEVWDTK